MAFKLAGNVLIDDNGNLVSTVETFSISNVNTNSKVLTINSSDEVTTRVGNSYSVNGETVVNENLEGYFGNVSLTIDENNSSSNTFGFLFGKFQTFQGTDFAFVSGGSGNPTPTWPGGGYVNTIDRFPFATDSSATDAGDLTIMFGLSCGFSSESHGYTSCGVRGPFTQFAPFPPAPLSLNDIHRFPFAATVSVTDVASGTLVRYGVSASQSSTHGYTSGGITSPGNVIRDVIDKFPFATSSAATDVGDLTQGRGQSQEATSSVHGYTAGGWNLPSPALNRVNTIDKFPFAIDTNVTDVGDLTASKYGGSSSSSTSHGYAAGGNESPAGGVNTIEKFPFAVDTGSSDVGDLLAPNQGIRGLSSYVSGYSVGGTPFLNSIEKYPFATDSGSSDVGDLTQGRSQSSTQQD